MTPQEIDHFFTTQNKILINGGIISITTMMLGLAYAPLALVGMIGFITTLIICDVRQTRFKKRLNP